MRESPVPCVRLASWWPLAVSALPLAVVGFVSGCGGSQAAPSAPPAPEVTVARPVVQKIVEWDRYTGRLAAIEAVEVRARVSGYLQLINFQEGQVVKPGKELCIIDQRPFRAAVESAEAKLAEAKAQLQRANAELSAAEATKKKADAALRTATRTFSRTERLFRSGNVTQDVFDKDEGTKLEAEATQAGAVASIAAAEAAIEVANAAVTTASANLSSARLDLNYTFVKAPVGGRIGDRRVTVGNLVDEGTVLTTIYSRNPIHCYFDANEQELLKYSRLALDGTRGSSRDTKNPVYLRLVDEKGYEHRGHMDFVDNRVDDDTGTIRGRAIFPNDDDLLTPGMFGEVRIPGSGQYEAILVPEEAIGTDQSEKFVYVLNDANEAVRTAVVLGPMVDGLRVVRSGLGSEKRIVVDGLQRVVPGGKVTPTEKTIEVDPEADGLPDEYEPVPRDKWLTKPPDEVPDEARNGIEASEDSAETTEDASVDSTDAVPPGPPDDADGGAGR